MAILLISKHDILKKYIKQVIMSETHIRNWLHNRLWTF